MLAAGGNTPPEASGTLLSAVTSTGTGTALDLGSVLSKHTVMLTWGGTVPTSISAALEGSLDNTNFYSIGSVDMNASPYMYHVVNKPVRYVRGNYIGKVGGDGTTALTMNYAGGGN